MLLKCQYTGLNRYLGRDMRQYFTQLYKRNDDRAILNHIIKFDGKGVRRKNDYLEFLQNRFYESTGSKHYVVYKAGARIPRLFVGCLALIGLSIFSAYYLLKDGISISKYRAILLLLNFAVLYKAVRSRCWQLGKYIKHIEISKELNTVYFNTYRNKLITANPEDVFFAKNSYFYMVQKDFLRSVCVEINIQGDNHYVQLHNALIPDKDIFSAVLKGYKLKKISI
jgi:hypothetical protein